MKITFLLLCFVVLSSAAPLQTPLIERATVAVPPRETVVRPETWHAQACDERTAPIRLREVVTDARGYPYGEVAAWSCTNVADATAEFERRKAAMEKEARP